jgi:hypothetical protein
MRTLLLLIPVGLLLFCEPVSGQLNKDSLSLVSKIYRDQYKLSKLLGQLEQHSNKKDDASVKAQSSADKNSTAADNLSDNPDNKKLARKAQNKASDAKKDSRNARIASDNLDKLHNEIEHLKNRIENNQTKLNKHIKVGSANSTVRDSIPN